MLNAPVQTEHRQLQLNGTMKNYTREAFLLYRQPKGLKSPPSTLLRHNLFSTISEPFCVLTLDFCFKITWHLRGQSSFFYCLSILLFQRNYATGFCLLLYIMTVLQTMNVSSAGLFSWCATKLLVEECKNGLCMYKRHILSLASGAVTCGKEQHTLNYPSKLQWWLQILFW